MRSAAKAHFVPRCVSSTSDPCCTLHEWLVFPPRGSTEFYADAAFSTLRVHAARKPNSHNGLKPAIRCCRERFLRFNGSFADKAGIDLA